MSEKELTFTAEDNPAETTDMPSVNGTDNDQSAENQKINTESVDPLASLQAEYDALKDKYIRLYAEFENFRRRAAKEKIDIIKTAAQDTMTALLPVLDDFDRAKKSAENPESAEPFSEGVALVYQKLHHVLQQLGLESMDTSDPTFDPDRHNAVAEIPAPSPELQGKIIDTIEKGYLLGGKIIRHAKVVIGK